MNDIKYDYIEMKKKKTIYLSLNTVLVITFISRIYHYFIHKNLWLDENLIAMAIYKTPLIDLLQGKYEYNQSCPLLFGLYNKILAIITNYSPSILYFIPTIVGILLILLIVKFCIQYDGILYAFICVAIISVCKMPLYYSTEFKQYIFEATATIFLLSNVIHDIQKQNIYIFFSKKYPLYFSFALLVSSTSIFISTGLALSIFIFILKKFNFSFKNLFIKFIYTYKWFLVFFIIYYIIYLKNTSSTMYTYWEKFFFPISITDWPNYIKTILYPIAVGMFQVKGEFLSNIFTIIIFILFPFGVYAIFKKNKFELFVFTTPLLVASISSFKIYPPGHPGMIGARLSLYLYPIIITISGYSILKISKFIISNISFRKIQIIFCLCITVILLINLSFAKSGMGWQQTYKLFKEIQNKKGNNDIVFVYYPARYALDYWLTFNNKNLNYVIIDRKYFHKNKNEIENFLYANLVQKKDNIYFVYSHHNIKHPDIIEEIFRGKGYKVETLSSRGAFLQKFYHNSFHN